MRYPNANLRKSETLLCEEMETYIYDEFPHKECDSYDTILEKLDEDYERENDAIDETWSTGLISYNDLKTIPIMSRHSIRRSIQRPKSNYYDRNRPINKFVSNCYRRNSGSNFQLAYSKRVAVCKLGLSNASLEGMNPLIYGGGYYQ